MEKNLLDVRYHSFLLRLWTSGVKNGEDLWRASLESSGFGKKQVFSNMSDLLKFLELLTRRSSRPGKNNKD